MTRRYRTVSREHRRFLFFLFVIIVPLLFFSCAPSVHTASSSPHETPKGRSESTLTVPNGWIVVADSTDDPSIDVLLARNDRAATMVLRELHLLGSAQRALENEDICVAGNISLQMKLVDDTVDTRILRTPAPTEGDPSSCFYTYSRRSLLRRVLVFRKKSKLYELELAQEKEEDQFSQFVPDQSAIARFFMGM